jgi:hypothetical protein
LALIFEWHNRVNWGFISYIIVSLLIISPVLTILWMSFCKFDVVTTIKEKVEIGFPWNLLFIVVIPTNSLLRWLINYRARQY